MGLVFVIDEKHPLEGESHECFPRRGNDGDICCVGETSVSRTMAKSLDVYLQFLVEYTIPLDFVFLVQFVGYRPVP